MPSDAKSLTGVVAGLVDGHFFAVDRGAALVWSIALAPKVRSESYVNERSDGARSRLPVC